MKCEKCGKDIPKGFSFCLVCNGTGQNDVSKHETVTSNVTQSNTEEETSQIQENINPNIPKTVVKCKCGQIIEPGWKFCPKCNNPISVEIEQSNIPLTENQKGGRNYAIVAIVSYVLAYPISAIFPPGFQICYLLSIISVIMGKIRYPKNIVLKVLFWFMILNFVMGAISIIWILIMCASC